MQPALVVIDSLSGCMPGVDNNKQEICKPLYDLEVSNGLEFPSTVFLIIHHNNKSNGMRGHSGIGDAVTETWGLDKPTEQECQEDRYGEETEMRRVITIGKSRIGREGDKLVTRMQEDFSMDIEDFTPVERTRQFSNKVPVIDQVHSHIRQMTKRGCSVTREELAKAAGSRGTPNAIRTSLRRLRTRGLIECVEGPMPDRGGSAPLFWFACTKEGLEMIEQIKGVTPGVISRGERENTSSSISTESTGITDVERCVTPVRHPVIHPENRPSDTPVLGSEPEPNDQAVFETENRCVTPEPDAPLNPVIATEVTGASPSEGYIGDAEQLIDPDSLEDRPEEKWI